MKKIAVAPAGVSFQEAVAGERIGAVNRRGKYAVLELASGARLVISLRMTGRLTVTQADAEVSPYAHVLFSLDDGRRLDFADIRQFGRVRLVAAGEQWDTGLGIEPLEAHFTPQAFIGMLSGRTTPIKVFLLDQRRIAGIGNIYACEALWEARIHPAVPAGALSKPAILRLHDALVGVLERSIAMRGSSIDDYVDAEGLKGGFQNVLSVYGKEGKACARCGGAIVRTVIGQRGTWWCRSCQRPRPRKNTIKR